MIHVPIIETDNPTRQIEVTHHRFDAPRGYWNKVAICPDHIKINVFVKGDFSIFVNDTRYQPVYGDICFLPPAQLHCGHVDSKTHLDYFQLDIGMHALDRVNGGAALLAGLIANSRDNRHFLRPHREDEDAVMALCHRLEAAVTNRQMPLAFAYVIEILTHIERIYAGSSDMPTIALSDTSTAVIRYIEAHFNEKITIEQMAESLGLSATYLSVRFKKEVGMGIHAYLNEYRVMRAIALLRTHTVAETCFACGFCDSSHFIATFKRRFGCTPAVYQKTRLR